MAFSFDCTLDSLSNLVTWFKSCMLLALQVLFLRLKIQTVRQRQGNGGKLRYVIEREKIRGITDHYSPVRIVTKTIRAKNRYTWARKQWSEMAVGLTVMEANFISDTESSWLTLVHSSLGRFIENALNVQCVRYGQTFWYCVTELSSEVQLACLSSNSGLSCLIIPRCTSKAIHQ